MGSSSVFVVGLTNLLYNFKGKKINKKELAKKSIFFEQKTLNETVGSQDQIAAAYGGFNKIIFNTKGNFFVNPISIQNSRIKKLNKNLVLLFTGINRTAHNIASQYVNKLQTSKKNHMKEIAAFVKEGEAIIRKGNLNDFGKLLHESWLEKKKLSSSISNSKIEDIYNSAIIKGALGGKLLGAGGGGFLMFYVPQKNQKSFIKYFKKFITIPFNFTSEGSKIMFNQFSC